MFTDEACEHGRLVVPERTAEQIERDARRAQELELERQQRAQERQREREHQRLLQEREQMAELLQAPDPAQSPECRQARQRAEHLSSFAGIEEIRTARANAALACGQAPVTEVEVLRYPGYGHQGAYPWLHQRPRMIGNRPGLVRPDRPYRPLESGKPAAGQRPVPVRIRPPGASR